MKALLIHRSPVIAKGLELIIHAAGEEAESHDWSGYPALERSLDASKPDIVLLDPNIRDIDSERLTGIVSALDRPVAVAFISSTETSAHMEEAINAGAQGYVSLNTSPQEFVYSLRLLAEGHVVATGPQVETLADVATEVRTQANGAAALTTREGEIVSLIADGLTNRQLAERLFLTEGTVKVHLRNIFRKLGISNRAELVGYAHRSGMAV